MQILRRSVLPHLQRLSAQKIGSMLPPKPGNYFECHKFRNNNYHHSLSPSRYLSTTFRLLCVLYFISHTSGLSRGKRCPKTKQFPAPLYLKYGKWHMRRYSRTKQNKPYLVWSWFMQLYCPTFKCYQSYKQTDWYGLVYFGAKAR